LPLYLCIHGASKYLRLWSPAKSGLPFSSRITISLGFTSNSSILSVKRVIFRYQRFGNGLKVLFVCQSIYLYSIKLKYINSLLFALNIHLVSFSIGYFAITSIEPALPVVERTIIRQIFQRSLFSFIFQIFKK